MAGNRGKIVGYFKYKENNITYSCDFTPLSHFFNNGRDYFMVNAQ